MFVSLAAHAAQFAFLVFFENPRKSTLAVSNTGPLSSLISDIERMYGQRKAIAKRTPLFPSRPKSVPLPSSSETVGSSTITSAVGTPVEADLADILSTPAVTEGETATETDFETELEIDDDTPITDVINRKLSKHQQHHSIASSVSSKGGLDAGVPRHKKKAVSQHDLLNKYFRRDAVVIRNIDFLR